ncbi:hypothetical protein AAFF_G00065190 [Aldrovandia affinis]|uniref:Kinesin motor domain-containing protein n=1 Tax=Aldrovandia affinis TaxID=143900 RepID=A0AAD7WY37_9TELE|nr:hypothetical protein AAFF_G00065190 [Aldrovandia affinis]
MRFVCEDSEQMAETRVKVALRIRPLLPREALREQQECVRVTPARPRQVIAGNERAFDFDFAFGPQALQEDVYRACVQPMLSSLMDGYNVTVFAYGQTGSGKTYTIGGGHIVSTPEGEGGIIPRAVRDIFLRVAQVADTAFSVRTSYIEVYNDQLRDLLEPETPSKFLHIREDERGNTVLIGARQQEVESGEELITLLEAGNAARRTGSNQLNERSSRSHALLTIAVAQSRPDAARSIASKFHLVDLAGSERMSRSASARHVQESVQINSGLLALGNVIRALADPRRRGQHVPYRDSKITRLLRDSLGGNSRTLLIACVSPAPACLQESLSSLLFASRARDVRNKPVVNWVAGRSAAGREREREHVGALEEELRALREALRGQGGAEQIRLRAYRALVQEAANLLLEIRDSTPNPDHFLRLQEWLQRQDELERESPTHNGAESQHNILQLQSELNRWQVHTGPPAYSLDMVMACFKARRRRLQAEIEEGDQVLLQGCEEGEEALLRGADEEEEEEEDQEQSRTFRRSLNLTWTHRASDRPSHIPTRRGPRLRPDLPQQTTPPTGNGVCVEVGPGAESANVHAVRSSQAINLQLLKEAGLRQSCTQQQIKELALNIRLKENLIRELQKTGKDTQVNDSSSLQELSGRVRKETRALVSLCLRSERTRVGQELSVAQMKQESERLKSALQEEESRKERIQEDLTRDLHRIRELQVETQQQEKELQHSSAEAQKLEEQRRWLEQEEEKVLRQRRGLQELEEELRRREEMVRRREELAQERSQIELHRLRSSQALGPAVACVDLLGLALSVCAISPAGCRRWTARALLEERGGAALEGLGEEREQLLRRRDVLDHRLQDGSVLTTEEERTLFQLEEAIDVLDAAVEYKTLTIDSRQRASALTTPHSEGDMMGKLSTLPPPHIKALLLKYFDKVVCLREEDRKLRLCCEEQQLQLQEQQGVVRELEAALQRLTLAADRRLTEQEREHQQSLQLLLQDLTAGQCEGVAEGMTPVEGRVQALEKELFFYKTTSRQLRRKLREVMPSLTSGATPTVGRSQDSDAPAHGMHLPEEALPSRAQDRCRLDEEAGRRCGSQRAESAPVRFPHRLRQISPPAPRARSSSFQEDSIETSGHVQSL